MSAQSAAAPARWAAILRRRLARRPDSEHEMSLNRIVIVSAIFAYLSLSHAMGFVEATAALVHGQIICFTYFAVSLLIFAHILWRPGVSHARRHVALWST